MVYNDQVVKINGPVVQLVRTPACHAGGREFEPHPGRQSLCIVQAFFVVFGKVLFFEVL